MWETWIPSVGLAGLLVLAMWIFSRGELEYQRGYWRGYEDGKCDEAARSEAAELRDRVVELGRTNFALSEDSAIVANENAELRAAAEEALEAIGRQQRDPAYHSAYLLLQRAARRLRAALAATEGSSK